MICGTLFLGEPFTAGSAAGVLLVLAGVAISTIQFKAKRLGKPNLQAADCADTGLLVFRTDVSFLK